MFRDVLNTSVNERAESNASLRSRSKAVPENARPLQEIAPGEKVQIVVETVPVAHLPLLQAMGLCSRCDLRVCQSRGTCILDVDGSRVGLSAQVAASIQAIPVAC